MYMYIYVCVCVGVRARAGSDRSSHPELLITRNSGSQTRPVHTHTDTQSVADQAGDILDTQAAVVDIPLPLHFDIREAVSKSTPETDMLTVRAHAHTHALLYTHTHTHAHAQRLCRKAHLKRTC